MPAPQQSPCQSGTYSRSTIRMLRSRFSTRLGLKQKNQQVPAASPLRDLFLLHTEEGGVKDGSSMANGAEADLGLGGQQAVTDSESERMDYSMSQFVDDIDEIGGEDGDEKYFTAPTTPKTYKDCRFLPSSSSDSTTTGPELTTSSTNTSSSFTSHSVTASLSESFASTSINDTPTTPRRFKLHARPGLLNRLKASLSKSSLRSDKLDEPSMKLTVGSTNNEATSGMPPKIVAPTIEGLVIPDGGVTTLLGQPEPTFIEEKRDRLTALKPHGSVRELELGKENGYLSPYGHSPVTGTLRGGLFNHRDTVREWGAARSGSHPGLEFEEAISGHAPGSEKGSKRFKTVLEQTVAEANQLSVRGCGKHTPRTIVMTKYLKTSSRGRVRVSSGGSRKHVKDIFNGSPAKICDVHAEQGISPNMMGFDPGATVRASPRRETHHGPSPQRNVPDRLSHLYHSISRQHSSGLTTVVTPPTPTSSSVCRVSRFTEHLSPTPSPPSSPPTITLNGIPTNASLLSHALSTQNQAIKADGAKRVLYFSATPGSRYPLDIESGKGNPAFVNLLTPLGDKSGGPRFVGAGTLEIYGEASGLKAEVGGLIFEVSVAQIMGLSEWEKLEVERGDGVWSCARLGGESAFAPINPWTGIRMPFVKGSVRWIKEGKPYRVQLRKVRVRVDGPGDMSGYVECCMWG